MHGLVKRHLLVDRSESVDELIAPFLETVLCCEMMWNFFRQRCCLLLQSCPSRQTKMKAFTAVFAEPDLWGRSPRSLESSRCWWWRRLAWRWLYKRLDSLNWQPFLVLYRDQGQELLTDRVSDKSASSQKVSCVCPWECLSQSNTEKVPTYC